MIAAIYARRSHEQNVPDEEKSVARQTELAMACAQKLGYEVRPEYVFVDDAITGAEFDRRPGLLRLLNSLKPRPPFSALVVADKDRLGREQFETSYVLKMVLVAGVKVVEYQNRGQEVRLESPTDKLIMAVSNFASEVERTKASQRTRDALRLKAQKSYVVGGSVFGYQNVPVFTEDGQRSHVVRRVRDDEAAVVRRIFEMSAAGVGLVTIAKALNAEGVRSPRSREGRHRSWAPSSVRAVLYNPLYKGTVVWGRTKKRDSWGRRKESDRPTAEWVTVSVEQLRIVTEDLWQRVHERLATMQSRFKRQGDVRRCRREGRYLLTGMARCGVCSGSIVTSVHGRQSVYRCWYNQTRGVSICTNGLKVRTNVADAVVLDAIRRKVLDREIAETALDITLEELTRPDFDLALVARREELKGELARIETELARYAEAIADLGAVDSLLKAIKSREERRAAIRAELKTLMPPKRTEVDPDTLRAKLREQLVEWEALTRRGIAEARQVLRELLLEPLALTPVPRPADWRASGPGRYPQQVYRFRARVTLASVFEGLIWVKSLVAPTGPEPVYFELDAPDATTQTVRRRLGRSVPLIFRAIVSDLPIDGVLSASVR